MHHTRAAQEIFAYLPAGVEFRDALTQVEQTVPERMRQIGARLIELHRAHRRLGYQGPSLPCRCGRTRRFVQYRVKTLATLLGAVRTQRAY